ncbi:hypothetical protein SAMN06265379_104318 [Saccharicrinis carchari]|uniref:Uncharacterized protein n=1 Tax=Saccharicrinis carchari TaxID=1168039 RepID=A0A521D788_SACCC|nr:hypothetical protein SAMN06265379_104318 [Saccharicrinis carchari]
MGESMFHFNAEIKFWGDVVYRMISFVEEVFL